MMLARKPFQRLLRLILLVELCWLMAGGLSAHPASAQPFRTYDPFYRSETARRTFFDGYAFSAEVYYRRAGVLQTNGLAPPAGEGQPERRPTPSPDPLGISFRVEHQLFSQLDLGAIFDASGGQTSRRITLSWLMLKYFRHIEQADYAFRLAVDPSSDGRIGFPQVDAAFLHTSSLSPYLSSDFALGIRRVRTGYTQMLTGETASAQGPESVDAPARSLQDRLLAVYKLAIGWEVHAMMSYKLYLDPAGSNLSVSLSGDLSSYDLVPLTEEGSPISAKHSATSAASHASRDLGVPLDKEYRGGVIWLRSGLTFSRPSYRATPFLALPLQQWTPDAGNWRAASLHLGLRLMLR